MCRTKFTPYRPGLYDRRTKTKPPTEEKKEEAPKPEQPEEDGEGMIFDLSISIEINIILT